MEVFSRIHLEKGTAMTGGVPSVAVQLTVRGDIPEEDRTYALAKVERALRIAHDPVLKAHLVLGWEPDPAHRHPARLEVGLDVNGVPIRAHIAADSLREGADLLQGRLARRLVQFQDRARARHRWTDATRESTVVGPEPHRPQAGRQDGDEPAEVLRRKTFASHPLTTDEAAYEMDLLDHDFYLYTDRETGGQAVIHRGEDGTGHDVLLAPAVLSEDQAREHLDLAGEPFVFYLPDHDGQGRVLYRRFDGQYGVITTA